MEGTRAVALQRRKAKVIVVLGSAKDIGRAASLSFAGELFCESGRCEEECAGGEEAA